MNFEKFMSLWKEQCRIKISDGWRKCQDQVIRDHILPYLCQRNVSEITRGHISEILNISRLKGHSPNQQKKIYMVLSKMFSDAVEWEWILKSPVYKRFHLPEVPKIEQPYMTYLESNIFLEATFGERYGPPAWTQLLSGLRVSEIQALEASDFKWAKGHISVTKAWNRHTKLIQPFLKNRSHNFPPIAPRLESYLRPRIHKTGFAFQNLSGGMMSDKNYDEFLKDIFTRLKFKVTSSHGLRHSCATYYRELGATDEQIKELLGHKTLSSTQTYLHETDKRLLEIAKKIA